MTIFAVLFGILKCAKKSECLQLKKHNNLSRAFLWTGWKKNQNIAQDAPNLYAFWDSIQKELSAQIANMKIFVLCVSENGMAQIVVEIKRVVSLSNISQVALGTKSLMSRIEQLVFFLTTWHLSTEPALAAMLFSSTWRIASIWNALFVDVISVGYVWVLQEMVTGIVEHSMTTVVRWLRPKDYDCIHYIIIQNMLQIWWLWWFLSENTSLKFSIEERNRSFFF